MDARGPKYMDVCIIGLKKKSDWISCRSISNNLMAAYDNVFSKIDYLILDSFSDLEVKGAVRYLVKTSPRTIVILEHAPHPKNIFKGLFEHFKNKPLNKRPLLCIHVYGDFSLYLNDWLNAAEYLKAFRVKFLCASSAQQKLVGSILNNPKQSLVCRFPISTKAFHAIESSINFRKSLGISDDESCFLYTGRMSRQKQVIALINCFAELIDVNLAEKKSLPHLVLAGPFDDIGIPYLKKHDHTNQFFSEFVSCYNDLSPEVRSRIHYVGNLNETQLVELYNQTDCFISLSLHNDEDYGISPAEALSYGLPALLTGWGGYLSFLDCGESVHLIKTKLSPLGPDFDRKGLFKLLMRYSDCRLDKTVRQKNAQFASKNLSIIAVAVVLKKILSSPFTKFTGFKNCDFTFFEEINGMKLPVFNKNKLIYNSSYLKLYKAYLHDG